MKDLRNNAECPKDNFAVIFYHDMDIKQNGFARSPRLYHVCI